MNADAADRQRVMLLLTLAHYADRAVTGPDATARMHAHRVAVDLAAELCRDHSHERPRQASSDLTAGRKPGGRRFTGSW